MVTIVPAADREGASCLEYRDGGRMCGAVCWRMEGEEGARLLSLEAETPLAAEALVRAALNAAELRGARTARSSAPEIAPLLDTLGFVRNGGGYEVDLREFFNRPCSSR